MSECKDCIIGNDHAHNSKEQQAPCEHEYKACEWSDTKFYVDGNDTERSIARKITKWYCIYCLMIKEL